MGCNQHTVCNLQRTRLLVHYVARMYQICKYELKKIIFSTLGEKVSNCSANDLKTAAAALVHV